MSTILSAPKAQPKYIRAAQVKQTVDLEGAANMYKTMFASAQKEAEQAARNESVEAELAYKKLATSILHEGDNPVMSMEGKAFLDVYVPTQERLRKALVETGNTLAPAARQFFVSSTADFYASTLNILAGRRSSQSQAYTKNLQNQKENQILSDITMASNDSHEAIGLIKKHENVIRATYASQPDLAEVKVADFVNTAFVNTISTQTANAKAHMAIMNLENSDSMLSLAQTEIANAEKIYDEAVAAGVHGDNLASMSAKITEAHKTYFDGKEAIDKLAEEQSKADEDKLLNGALSHAYKAFNDKTSNPMAGVIALEARAALDPSLAQIAKDAREQVQKIITDRDFTTPSVKAHTLENLEFYADRPEDVMKINGLSVSDKSTLLATARGMQDVTYKQQYKVGMEELKKNIISTGPLAAYEADEAPVFSSAVSLFTAKLNKAKANDEPLAVARIRAIREVMEELQVDKFTLGRLTPLIKGEPKPTTASTVKDIEDYLYKAGKEYLDNRSSMTDTEIAERSRMFVRWKGYLLRQRAAEQAALNGGANE